MAKDSVYTRGVIAVKETHLLGDKLLKLCETDAEEAFRMITESGFGKGADAVSAYDYEKLLAVDEKETDAFIAEYAPSRAAMEYLLAPRDFHNAKALLKAHCIGAEADGMLAPQGLVSVEMISRCVEAEDFSALGGELAAACKEAAELFGGESEVTGAQIGAVFERALFRHLAGICSKNGTLKTLLAAKADMTNVLTVLRSDSFESAKQNLLSGGRLSEALLEKISEGDAERAERALSGTDYSGFLRLCLEAKAHGMPFTQAEKTRDNFETEFFTKRKFELKRSEPFLYYVFRRRAENANVRILFVCLLAGLDEQSIKNRLRLF